MKDECHSMKEESSLITTGTAINIQQAKVLANKT